LVTITSLSQYTESLAHIIALTLRGSHRGGNPRPQEFSQEWKLSPSGVLIGVEALALRSSLRGGSPCPQGFSQGWKL